MGRVGRDGTLGFIECPRLLYYSSILFTIYSYSFSKEKERNSIEEGRAYEKWDDGTVK